MCSVQFFDIFIYIHNYIHTTHYFGMDHILEQMFVFLTLIVIITLLECQM